MVSESISRERQIAGVMLGFSLRNLKYIIIPLKIPSLLILLVFSYTANPYYYYIYRIQASLHLTYIYT